MTTVSGQGPTSHSTDLDGPVHWADYGGPVDGPLLVGVHGLGGSHLNWAALAPLLTGRNRLIAVDLLGHGHTPTAGRTPDIAGHVALLDAVLDRVVEGPAVLVGNSMGGLVATLVAADSPARVSGLVLVDPALPTGRPGRVHPRVLTNFALCAVPGLGERYLTARRNRTTAEQTVRRVLATTCVDPARVPPDVVEAHIAFTEEADRERGDDAYLVSARSLAWSMARPGPTLERIDRLRVPVLHLHGERDVLIPLTVARRMAEGRDDWRLEVARDIGHAPMLEAPVWTALRIQEWLDDAVFPAEDPTDGRTGGRRAAGSGVPLS